MSDVRNAWQLDPAVREALPHEWMKTTWDRWAETVKLGDTLEDRYTGYDINTSRLGKYWVGEASWSGKRRRQERSRKPSGGWIKGVALTALDR